MGVHIGLDGGGDVSDVMREEAGIWGDDLNMEYRIRRDDWNMGTPAALAVPRVVGGAGEARIGGASDARGGDGWS